MGAFFVFIEKGRRQDNDKTKQKNIGGARLQLAVDDVGAVDRRGRLFDGVVFGQVQQRDGWKRKSSFIGFALPYFLSVCLSFFLSFPFLRSSSRRGSKTFRWTRHAVFLHSSVADCFLFFFLIKKNIFFFFRPIGAASVVKETPKKNNKKTNKGSLFFV